MKHKDELQVLSEMESLHVNDNNDLDESRRRKETKTKKNKMFVKKVVGHLYWIISVGI